MQRRSGSSWNDRRRTAIRPIRPLASPLHRPVRRFQVPGPVVASIIRERLFKMARIRSDVRNNKSNKDGSAIQCFLVEKLATSIPEVADRGLAQGTAVAVGKIEAPLV